MRSCKGRPTGRPFALSLLHLRTIRITLSVVTHPALITRALRWYVRLYDKAPLVVGLAGVYGSGALAFIAAVLCEILAARLGLSQGWKMVALSIPALPVFPFLIWTGLLAIEAMWRTFFIYALFGIKGRPLRDHLCAWLAPDEAA